MEYHADKVLGFSVVEGELEYLVSWKPDLLLPKDLGLSLEKHVWDDGEQPPPTSNHRWLGRFKDSKKYKKHDFDDEIVLMKLVKKDDGTNYVHTEWEPTWQGEDNIDINILDETSWKNKEDYKAYMNYLKFKGMHEAEPAAVATPSSKRQRQEPGPSNQPDAQPPSPKRQRQEPGPSNQPDTETEIGPSSLPPSTSNDQIFGDTFINWYHALSVPKQKMVDFMLAAWHLKENMQVVNSNPLCMLAYVATQEVQPVEPVPMAPTTPAAPTDSEATEVPAENKAESAISESSSDGDDYDGDPDYIP